MWIYNAKTYQVHGCSWPTIPTCCRLILYIWTYFLLNFAEQRHISLDNLTEYDGSVVRVNSYLTAGTSIHGKWGWRVVGWNNYGDVKFKSSPPKENGCHFGRRQFQMHFLNENDRTPIWISLKYVCRSLIDHKPALVQVMAGCWTGNKPLPELMLTQFTDA